MLKSFFYKSPVLYKLGLKLIHRENLAKRYQYLASLVEREDLVLEPGCGPAILADFLPEDSLYYGFDLNEIFLNYALSKNKKVFLGNVTDSKNYFLVDIIICVDILHHLKLGEREKFIENCWKFTKKKLILCEPYKERGQSKFWFEYIEKDGKNSPKFGDFWTKEELRKQIENGFNKIDKIFSRKIVEIGKDLVVIFCKNDFSNSTNF